MKDQITKDQFSQLVEKIARQDELEAYDFLEEATCIVMDEPVREVIVEGIRARKKWLKIKRDYDLLKESGYSGEAAIYALAKRYKYSTKTVEAIVYSRWKK